jgi:hypothetical protein
VKMIIRLGLLALSAYGAWKLYEEYGDRVPALRQSVDEFSGRTSSATKDAAERVGYAADDASSAIGDSAADIRDAAKDAQERVTRTLQETPTATTRQY